MIRLLEHTFDAPAENLAFEEAMLDAVEQGAAPDTLRIWESASPFVVLGTAQVLTQEVNEANCAEDGVSIMRRCSAGGCVLQGPGCLNFSLALTYANYPEVKQLHASYCHILGKLCAAFQRLGIDITCNGISDLALDGRKVSGNAQRRRKRAVLHHGTLLYKANHAGMKKYLREPQDRPDYRGRRSHAEFVHALPCTATAIRTAIRNAFKAPEDVTPPTPEELAATQRLADEKYLTQEWIRRR